MFINDFCVQFTYTIKDFCYCPNKIGATFSHCFFFFFFFKFFLGKHLGSVKNPSWLYQESLMALWGVCHGSRRSPLWLCEQSVTCGDWLLLLLLAISHPGGLFSELWRTPLRAMPDSLQNHYRLLVERDLHTFIYQPTWTSCSEIYYCKLDETKTFKINFIRLFWWFPDLTVQPNLFIYQARESSLVP